MMKGKIIITEREVLVSIVIALLAAAASVVGLFTNYPYSLETENWKLQAQGQDIGNVVAAAVLIISILMARKGSLRAYLVWLGTLFYFLYAYLIYAVAVHFNSLFLVYVGTFGLTLYTLIFSLGRGMHEVMPLKARKFASYTLIATGILFGLLWLGEVIPASISGEAPQSTKDAGLWVNPIHVIDLSTVLPGFIITGVLALKSRPAGLFFTAPWLIFSVLMGSSIVAAMIIMTANGFDHTIPPMVMVSAIVVLSLLAANKYLKHLKIG